MHYKTARDTWLPTDFTAAQVSQLKVLRRTTDLEDLHAIIPALSERARIAREASRKADDELASVLLEIEERRVHG